MTESKIVRRRYGATLKVQVIAECDRPGASVARVAMAHGINANVVHKWRRQAQAHGKPVALPNMGVFVPVPLVPATPNAPADIRMELRRGPVTVTLTWPTTAATECAHWLREVLR